MDSLKVASGLADANVEDGDGCGYGLGDGADATTSMVWNGDEKASNAGYEYGVLSKLNIGSAMC